MVRDHLDDDANPSIMRAGEESFEIGERAIAWMNGAVIGNIVTIVAQGRWEEWHKPDRVDSQFLHVVESLRKSLKIADAVIVAVAKAAYVDLIDNGVFVPA